MQPLFRWLATFAVTSMFLSTAAASEVDEVEDPPVDRRYFVSMSAFMLFNLLPFENPPHFVQVNMGMRVTPKNTFILQAITWQYHAPLGVPYGPLFEDSSTLFPGSARDYGVGLAYQRYFWRGLYGMVDATPFVQIYNDRQGERIQTGFQLFVTGRVGYRFDLFNKRMFVEPSVAFTSWPINTNLPAGFQAQEDRFGKVFLPEPGVNVGVAF